MVANSKYPFDLFSKKDKYQLERWFEEVPPSPETLAQEDRERDRQRTHSGSSAVGGLGGYRPGGPEKFFGKLINIKERPFARLASLIAKYPWHSKAMKETDMERLYECLCGRFLPIF